MPTFLANVCNTIAYKHPHSTISKLFILAVFYAVGILHYTYVEGWTFVECIYFITVTITTCGYGFFHPTTDPSKIFTIFYIFVGIIVIFTMFQGLTIETLNDAQDGLVSGVRGLLGYKTPLSRKENRVIRLQLAVLAIGVVVLTGVLFYSANEDWTTLDAAYWVICTMTTIGYGTYIQYLHHFRSE
jgi:multidrug transporter EmrE-like cation transporter